MGYLTYFTINKIEGSDEDFDALLKDINDELGINFQDEDCQEAKWYDYGKDMCRLTRKYPSLLVQLDGDGEDSHDIWAARYRNGIEETISYINDDVSFAYLRSENEIKNDDTKPEPIYRLDVIFGDSATRYADEYGPEKAIERIKAGKIEGDHRTVYFDTKADMEKAAELLTLADGCGDNYIKMTDTSKRFAEPGTLIHGTLRNIDLIPAMKSLLFSLDRQRCREYLQKNLNLLQALCDLECPNVKNDWWDTEEATEVCNELAEILDDYAPDGHYFGTHPGDGSDYGFWPLTIG